jgi:thiamine-phosphate pyrophosphorylase
MTPGPKGPGLPRLQAILDVDAARAAGLVPPDLLLAFLDGGATWIQVRAKQLASKPLLELCDAAVKTAASYRASIIVNDRADIAALSGAGGVHVGQDDLPPAAARTIVGSDRIVGYSTHTIEQVRLAAREPVSYIAVGPVFGTRSKNTGYEAVGLALVTAAAHEAAPTPLVAIGGITLDTAASVIEAGAASVAVISDLLVTGDARGRVGAYLSRLRV